MTAGYSSASSPLSPLPTGLFYHFVDSQAPLPSPLLSTIVPVPVPVSTPIPVFVPIPVLALVPAPVSAPVTVSSFPFLGSCSPFGTTSSGRRRVLRLKLMTTCRRYLLSTEMLPRSEWQYLVFFSASFLMWRDIRALLPPSFLSPFSFPFLSSLQSPFLLPFRSRSCLRSSPHSRFRSVPVSPTALVSVPALVLRLFSRLHPRPHHHSRPRPRSLLLVPRAWLLPRYNARAQTPALANRVAGHPQAPLPVCRDDDAYGMKVRAVKQNRTVDEDVLLPFPPPDARTRWSVSSTCALPV